MTVSRICLISTRPERLASSDSVSSTITPTIGIRPDRTANPSTCVWSYVYDPADLADGVTVHVPLKAPRVSRLDQFTWNVPGLLMS